MDIPKQPSWMGFRSDHWPAVAGGLYLLATTGISMRSELESLLAKQRHTLPRANPIRSVFERNLVDEDLIHKQTVPTFGRHRVALVRLSEEGKEVCRTFGWTVIQCEWERLVKLHSANRQPQHTGAIVVFAHHARLRGWKAQVLPQIGSPVFFPDLVVERDEQRIYVEVELGSRKHQKWCNMQEAQGFVALCARTPKSRQSLITECRQVGTIGLATDLTTLYRESKNSDIGPLWAEDWS